MRRIQQLRQYDRSIFDLDAEIVRKLAKLDGVMQRCNIRLSNYVSNTDTKSYKNVVRKLCEGVTEPEELIKETNSSKRKVLLKHGMRLVAVLICRDSLRLLAAKIFA